MSIQFRVATGLRKHLYLCLGLVLSASVLLGGCRTAASEAVFSEPESHTEAGTVSSAQTRDSAGARAVPVGPLRELNEQAVFYLAYNVAFYAGGFWVEEHDFRESEGIRWRIEARDAGGTYRIEAVRALLQRNKDGSSWWYLSYGDSSRTFEYEVLLDDFYSPLTKVYQRPGRHTPVRDDINYAEFGHDIVGDGGGMDTEAERQLERFGVTELVFLSPGELRSRRRSTGTTEVPAGRFSYEHVQYTMQATEADSAGFYEWWFSNDVPGGMVRYEWREDGTNRFFRGELVEIGTGYTTRYGVY